MNSHWFQQIRPPLAGGAIALLGLLVGCESDVVTKDQLADAYLTAPSHGTDLGTARETKDQLADAYLTALQTGDVATAQSLYCIPSAYPDAVSPFDDYTIVMMEPDISVPNQPTISRTVLQVSLTGSADDSERLHLGIWNTNDLYLVMQAENLEWRSLGGEPIFDQPRSEWRDETLCVFETRSYDPYLQVEVGMSLDEVREILRSPGEVDESSGGIQVMRWQVPSGAYYAYVELVNNRVQAKWLRYYD
ncbi:hypothetical protein [Leptolyngbya sp. PCC 6406]|uniref:hypothetical protein n=1 Tax=Leptolyngbya sp. PCC 6406 TaxID=1173264 RepID=UPI0012DE58D1|nr:hypothetical protein [Leptolyngbya sp. PCC 6406]